LKTDLSVISYPLSSIPKDGPFARTPERFYENRQNREFARQNAKLFASKLEASAPKIGSFCTKIGTAIFAKVSQVNGNPRH
jgi:hypothetical protein